MNGKKYRVLKDEEENTLSRNGKSE